MKKILFLLFIGLSISSCSNDDDDNQNSSLNLVGTWNWTRSSGGFIGETTTPASSGDIIRLEITNTVIKKYVNNNLISESDYIVEISPTMAGEPREMIIKDNGDREIIDLEGSILTLTGDCSDCYISDYEKNN
jgi:hypothetical protein